MGIVMQQHSSPTIAASADRNSSDYALRLASTYEHWYSRIQIRAADGLATILLKLALRFPASFVLSCIFLPIMRHLESPSKALMQLVGDTGDTHRWWIAIDIYKGLMTTLLIISYWLVTEAVRYAQVSWTVRGLIIVISIIAALRCMELFVLLMLLFNDPAYTPRSSFRTVANSFWHYLEVILVFATLYAAACAFERGAICTDDNRSLIDERHGPFYFSVVTMATIGYGDYTPNNLVVRILVCAQVFLGLFLVLMVLPSCIAGFAQRTEAKATTARRRHDELPWLSNIEVDEQNVVRIRDGGAQLGCVLLIASQDLRHILLVQKQSYKDYEHSEMWAMPGGTVRTTEEPGDVSALIRNSLLIRIGKETGLTVSSEQIAQLPMIPPPASAATRFNERRVTIVIPFILLSPMEVETRTAPNATSIAQCKWIERPLSWQSIAPANRVILAFALWNHLSDEEQVAARGPVQSALIECNGWAGETGLPPAHLWFLESPLGE